MIFEALYEAACKNELLLIDGGFCHFHLRRDGQLTIREIISTRPGAGSEMLGRLRSVPNIKCIVARCPDELPSNDWYARKGFVIRSSLLTKSGKKVNEWCLYEDNLLRRRELSTIENSF